MKNKTVLITGASTGIGYELAKIFNKEGYNLVLVSRNKERLERVTQIGFKGLMNGDRVIIADFRNYLQVLLIRFTPMSLILKITKWLNS